MELDKFRASTRPSIRRGIGIATPRLDAPGTRPARLDTKKGRKRNSGERKAVSVDKDGRGETLPLPIVSPLRSLSIYRRPAVTVRPTITSAPSPFLHRIYFERSIATRRARNRASLLARSLARSRCGRESAKYFDPRLEHRNG